MVRVGTGAADIPGVNAGTPRSSSGSPDLSAAATAAVGGVGGAAGVDATTAAAAGGGADVGAESGAADGLTSCFWFGLFWFVLFFLRWTGMAWHGWMVGVLFFVVVDAVTSYTRLLIGRCLCRYCRLVGQAGRVVGWLPLQVRTN